MQVNFVFGMIVQPENTQVRCEKYKNSLLIKEQHHCCVSKGSYEKLLISAGEVKTGITDEEVEHMSNFGLSQLVTGGRSSESDATHTLLELMYPTRE